MFQYFVAMVIGYLISQIILFKTHMKLLKLFVYRQIVYFYLFILCIISHTAKVKQPDIFLLQVL